MTENNEPKYIIDYMREVKSLLKMHALDIESYQEISFNLKKESPAGLNDLFDYMNRHGPLGKDHIGDSILGLHNAFLALTAVGCDEWAMRVAKIIPIISVMDDGAKAYANMKIREDKSKAKKGKTNRHKAMVLKIASKTWGSYPNASLGGMQDEIYAHIRAKWNDCPTSETVRKWLKDSGLNPVYDSKNRDFKLISDDVQ
ncbi:hypothetical protein [Rouxiella badensis]|uniref:hypothetical protein n=1 Tax=Rouxiella badensis TaxID=1646377 RepID=UPI001787E5A1|nr:hypothetical protein [Rouxiella badensis]QOI56579.1 hypothetical protein H2866_05445 [Rouxiella badensis subsp. acadiensis]